MKIILSIAVFFIISCSVEANEIIDIIYLKDSTIIKGTIIEQIPNESLTIRDFKNEIHKIKFEDVLSIKTYDLADISLYRKNYFELGGSFGTPAGFNLNAAGWYQFLGIGISGMYLGNDRYGIQGNLKIKISDNYNRCHSISFLLYKTYRSIPNTQPKAPYYIDEDISDMQVYCITYNLNYNGFWLEIGPGMNFWYTKNNNGIADNWFPFFAFQIGYVHRFID
ncbi:MAG: hypothetical protein V1779_17255 [bacterium]